MKGNKLFSRSLAVIVVIMAGINIALLYQNYKLKNPKDDYAEISLIRKKIPPYFFKDLAGAEVSTRNLCSDNNLNLLIFFTLNDCVSCLSELSFWQKAHLEYDINVVGIAGHVSKSELKAWVDNFGITYPILFDKDNKFTRRIMGIEQTPLKVLVDNKSNVLLVDPARISLEEQESFLRTVRSFL